MACAFPIPRSPYYVVDSFPLAVCKFGRARYCRAFRGYGADYGWCASKKESYFGYKVHALITLEGYVTTFGVTPASTDDREGLRDLAGGTPGAVILGDKGYVGEALSQEMASQGVCLMALKRSNSRSPLAGVRPPVDLPEAEAGGDRILTADRAAECGKGARKEPPGAVYPALE